MQVKEQQIELNMEQQTGSKLGMEYVKDVYCHSAYLTYIQSTSCEMLDWMKCKLESRLLEEIPRYADDKICKISKYFRYADDTTLMAESEEELKSLLMKVKKMSEKLAYSSTFKKLRS